MAKTTAHATPEKSFFIRMITRDIDLDDCILDLLDNSIDGAKRVLQARGDLHDPGDRFAEFHVDITLEEERFEITDNCGGIRLEDARDYAFHFGRRRDEDREPEESIGIYGIGMKRAMFKIGRKILVVSSTEENAFEVQVDVEEWETNDEWTFPMETADPWEEEPGTQILIEDLNDGVGDDFGTTSFVNEFRRTIAQDYALFLQEGLTVQVNGTEVGAMRFELREGGQFRPAKISYEDGPVEIELAAGMAAPPPEDDSAEAQQELRDVERYGWFVLCNDRVVLAGDKTDKTIWGDSNFNRWHPQYNGFMGIAHFRSDEPGELPWTTTKRNVDETDPRYRRAVAKMKDLTTPFIEYTNARKDALDEAKELEEDTQARDVEEIEEREQMVVPQIDTGPRIEMANIHYRKPKSLVRKVGEALGNRNMAYKRVGIATFEYFCEREVEE